MITLIVEDNEDKLDAIYSFVSAALGTSIDVAKSYHEAKIFLSKQKYDLVLLDMSIPIYGAKEGGSGSVLVYGGEDLLAWAKWRIRGLQVIVITQFDAFISLDGVGKSSEDLADRLYCGYPDMFRGLVNYRDTDNLWQSQLLKRVNELGER